MRYFLLLFLALVTMASCQDRQSADFQYEISPLRIDSTEHLKVIVAFTPEADGSTNLLFQDKAWGQDSLHQIVADIRILDVAGEVTSNPARANTAADGNPM